MAIQIDDAVALPKRPSSEFREALEVLKVGQSFAFPMKKTGYIRTVAHWVKTRTTAKFAVRNVDESTARIWRTE